MRRSLARSAVMMTVVSAFAISAIGAAPAAAELPELVGFGGAQVGKEVIKSTSIGGIEVAMSKSTKPFFCSATVTEGWVTGLRTSVLKVRYTGCALISGTAKCQTPGHPSGTITTNVLTAKLVYLNKEHTIVGWHLEPVVPNGTFMEVSCSAVPPLTITVGEHEASKGGLDTLLVEFAPPYNKYATELKPLAKCKNEGTQVWSSYWEGTTNIVGFLEDQIKTEPWERFCITSEGSTLHFEEEVKINA